MTRSRRDELFAVSFVALVPTLLFLDVVLGKGVFYIRDVALYHFPLKRILREIVLRGEFPFWNAWISAGQPLAANPAHEVFYPLNWLIFLPDYIYGFQLMALVHVHIAALGTYALLRSMSVSRTASIIGALSFGIGGFVLSGLNLFPFLFSAAWMPFTFLFGRRAILGRTPRDFAFATFFLALQCLVGEPVTLLQTGFVLGAYAIAVAIEARRARQVAKNLLLVAALGIAALLVSAVQMLPAIDHARDSVRSSGFTFVNVSDWSTPPLRFIELVFPDFFGSRVSDSSAPKWGHDGYGERTGPFFPSIYGGLFALLTAVSGVLARVRGRGLYLVIAGTSAALALGSHTPLLRVLYDAGITQSIRYPEKFLIMGLFATVVFAAIALDRLLRHDRVMRRMTLAVTATVALIALAGWASTIIPEAENHFRDLWSLDSDEDVPAMLAAAKRGWTVASGGALVLLLLVAGLRHVPARVMAVLLIAFALIDIGKEAGATAPRTSRAFYEQLPMTVATLPLHRNDYRVFLVDDWNREARNRQGYSHRREHAFLLFRNALAGFASATYGIRGVMEIDIDLTSLRATNEFALAIWGVSSTSSDWLNYAAAMSNIWYVGRYRPFEEALAEAGGDARLIQPIRWIEGRHYPRYYFATEIVPTRSPAEFIERLRSGRHDRQAAFVNAARFRPAPARVVRWVETANGAMIDVESSGLAFLIMSVSAHKYWTVTIDGVEIPALVTNVGYQGVPVPEGRHIVTMRYYNPLIVAGAGISIAAMMALLAIAFRRPAVSTMRTP